MWPFSALRRRRRARMRQVLDLLEPGDEVSGSDIQAATDLSTAALNSLLKEMERKLEIQGRWTPAVPQTEHWLRRRKYRIDWPNIDVD
jgi:hypothetical protein